MTSYNYKLTLSDSESIMLDEALKKMIERCETEIAKGGTAPFCSWLQSAIEVKGRIYKNSEITSFFSGCRE